MREIQDLQLIRKRRMAQQCHTLYLSPLSISGDHMLVESPAKDRGSEASFLGID